MKKNIVEVKDLSVSYNGKKVFENLSFSVAPGQIIGIIGPNGAGKSTLIKAMMGLLHIDHGSIAIMNNSINKARKKIAYVPQRNDIDLSFPILVEDVVMLGRYPHLTWWGRPATKDWTVVEACLKQVGMLSYRKTQIGQLSGGQQQRIFLARALAQEADIFFLDEPFVGIDITSEQVIMEILTGMKNDGKTLFVVHHDLSKAETYFDSLILLKNRLIACGNKEDVLQMECLREAYDGKALLIPQGDRLMVVNS